ncbi:hypothetical protein SAMN05444396_10421 [Flavobacterium segetis]|uniref:Uncharacterized protein n=1 Tax=Flavobacterium segetis TaxID=271157 RepID=A0A1M5GM46_9FLAO|nr:hypothetical protein SAMN05444396_10421 [Flavobacterium segetis]
MKGLLKDNSEIEKLVAEYKMMSKINFDCTKIPVFKKELILEKCES